MHKIEKILVPIDFSENSRVALEYAIFEATHHQAAIDIMHVYFSPRHLSPEMLLDLPQDVKKAMASHLREKAEEAMTAFIGSLTVPEELEITRRLEIGRPMRTIVAIAKRDNHDLIVIGTRGQNRLKSLLLGSVAERVVSRAPCPVVAVPPTKQAKQKKSS